MVKNTTISVKTKGELDIIDITDRVKDFLKSSGTKNGFLNIQTLHTTATVFVNEKEPLLIEDFKRHLDKLAPRSQDYQHDDFSRRTVNMCDDECANGCSHCRAINMPSNVCLNIIDGKLQLGQWQKILFIELDRPRERRIQLQIMGA